MERRSEDARIAVLESQYGDISKSLERIEVKLNLYNQYRERLDNACLSIKEHKENHWQTITIAVVITGVMIAALGVALKLFKIGG